MKTKVFTLCKGLGLLLFVQTASAQWASQSILLRSGWNAVYLEVQPEPRNCDRLFAGLPVESVWRFNRKQTSVQFIDNPNELLPNAPDWLTWLPVAHPLSSQARLYTVDGGRPYLIKVADNVAPFNWSISGVPVIRKPEWLSDSLNFVGFSLPASNPPTLQAYFTNSAALATNRIYRLNTNGVWLIVNRPDTNRMQRGEAFWIRSTGLPDYPGPLDVQLERRAGLDFDRSLTEQTIRIRNTSTNVSRAVLLRQQLSEAPGAGHAALAGSVPLSHWHDSSPSNRGWANFPALLQSNVPPGATWEVRLQVRRRDMAPYSPPPGVFDVLYQSLLEVTDSSNSTRIVIPVMARGLRDYNSGQGGGIVAASGLVEKHPRRGLWIGSASINRVSQPPSGTPLETGSDFPFRILVHVNAAGEATFLQRVLQMFKPAQTNLQGQIIENAHFVLLTDESRIRSEFQGAALRDGKAVGRRFSTAAFGFRDYLPMSGSGFGDAGAKFACDVIMAHTNALNPFVHVYHPDHNNLDDRRNPLPLRTTTEGLVYTSESSTIKRSIKLQFQANDPNQSTLPGWGDTQLGGAYSETIYGVHRTPLVVSGTFRLFRASDIAVLNQ